MGGQACIRLRRMLHGFRDCFGDTVIWVCGLEVVPLCGERSAFRCEVAALAGASPAKVRTCRPLK